jgi:sugar lactone lactonase YvrE
VQGLRLSVFLLCAALLGLLPDAGQADPGFIVTVAGNYLPPSPPLVSPVGTYTGDGGAATLAGLYSPYSMTMDRLGNLYIAEAGNHVIRKVDALTAAISTVAGTGGVLGFSGDSGAATSAKLQNPSSVAVDGTDNLYIADRTNKRIRKVNAGGIISTVAGTGVSTGTITDGSAATLANLGSVYSIVLDPAGNLYIADFTHNTVWKMTTDGKIYRAAGNGVPGFSGDNGAAVSAQLYGPNGLAVDSTGNLYIAESFNHIIRRVDAVTGIITTVAGVGTAVNPTGAYSGDGGPAKSASLNSPKGVAVDKLGNIYIADTSNHSIRMVEASNGNIYHLSGGLPEFSGDNGPAGSAQLNAPTGVTLDAAGNLYIADSKNNRVRKIIESIVPTVAISPAAGTYSSLQNVTLTANEKATIYYTIDGSFPNLTSPSFNTTGQVPVGTSLTLWYFAVDTAGNASDPVAADYTLIPGPPTAVTATATVGQAVVSFTPPAFNGGFPISFYTVTSNPGGITTVVTSSPATVTGLLTDGTSYTFTVTATGTEIGLPSAPSNSVTPSLPVNYNLTLGWAGTGAGSVNGGSVNADNTVNSEVACVSGATCPAVSFLANKVVSLTATPTGDSLFASWAGCGSVVGNKCTVTMTSAKTATVTFDAIPKLMIVGGLGYDLISNAFAAALNNAVLEVRNLLFDNGDLTYDRAGISVLLKGGYDTSFVMSNIDTVLKGKLMIKNGTLRVDSLHVR